MTDNPYQSFSDWVFARWTCPECGVTWRSHGTPFFSDCISVAVKDGEVVERRIECPDCGFEEILENDGKEGRSKGILSSLLTLVSIPFILIFAALADLWSRLTFNPHCEKCGAKLIKTGYPKDFVQHYKCPECYGGVLRNET